MRQCLVSLLCSNGVCPNMSLGSCPSRYHLCFPKSISEILHVPFANDEGDASWHGSLPDKTKSVHHLLVPVPSLHRPLPVLHRTSGQQAGPCFEVKWSVTFRPTLGQRSSLELCRRICRGSGVERGSLQPASRPKPVYHEAVTGVTVPQPQHLWGVANTWGVGDCDEKPLLANNECQGDVLLRCCSSRNHFPLQKLIKPENHLCIGWSLWVSVLEVVHWGANNAFLAVLWIIASTAVERRAILWPGDPLRKDCDASRVYCLLQTPEEQMLQAAIDRLC